MRTILVSISATAAIAAVVFFVVTDRIAPPPIINGQVIRIASIRGTKRELVVQSPFVLLRHVAALNGTCYLVRDASGGEFWVGDYSIGCCLVNWAEPLVTDLPVVDLTWANPELHNRLLLTILRDAPDSFSHAEFDRHYPRRTSEWGRSIRRSWYKISYYWAK